MLDPDKSIRVSSIMAHHTTQALSLYNKFLELDVANEMARMILPQNMYTEFYASVNLHNLVHFLKLRSDKHAQLEIQNYSNAIIELIRPIVPKSIDILLKN